MTKTDNSKPKRDKKEDQDTTPSQAEGDEETIDRALKNKNKKQK